jgi:hypothetical protein
MKRSIPILLALAISACGGAEQPKPAEATPAKSAPSNGPNPETDAKTDGGPAVADTGAATPTVTPTVTPPTEPVPPPAIPEAAPGEIAISPWSTSPHTATWLLAAEPAEALTFVGSLQAGVLGRTTTAWLQLGEGGQLVAAEMDVEPKADIQGLWPSDAWWIEERWKKEEGEEGMEFEYQEIRLMKLRGGNRWVPQEYNFNQWFHPGTDGELHQRASTLSGMLVISGFDSITRVAGKHPDPTVGPHRGEVREIIESGSGKVYVISVDDSGLLAQIECEDDACVAEKAAKLPVSDCNFGRQVARGRHSVSMAVTCSGREFILHHRGKSDGWLLDELPAGEKPSGMWASEEGGLWTLTGDRLRWRDTESVWRDVALPEGLTAPSFALTEDRKQVWLAGTVGGAAKVFTTNANAEVAGAPVPAAPVPAPPAP